MFTGIIESAGIVRNAEFIDENLVLNIESNLAFELKPDQSVAHNGICLTVISTFQNTYKVCAVHETIRKTTIASWQTGMQINLERGLPLNGRLDGHLVQGHIDTLAKCISTGNSQNQFIFRFSIPREFMHLIIEKGSICIDGISLTCFNIQQNEFDIAVIPYTFQNSNIRFLGIGSSVNIEFDILGKYLARHLTLSGKL